MQKITTITGKDLDGKKVSLTKSRPQQLDFFQLFYQDEARYSNTIGLYDAAPKYFSSPKKMDEVRKDGIYLKILERSFLYRNPVTGIYEEYILEITPARIRDKNKNEKEYYPTEREEIIEEALRKIAADKSKGVYLNDEAGVQFTLYELRKELKIQGHSIHFEKLIESLTVSNRTNITIRNLDGRAVISAPIFPTLLIANRNDWEQNPKGTKCYIQFNPLVTLSINSLAYRQHDYIKWMGYKRQLTRWLHKRIWNNYIYAGIDNKYNLRASSIIRDSGLINHSLFRRCITSIDESMDELKENKILRSYEKNINFLGRKIHDVRYDLYPTWEFIQEMKAANHRYSNIKEQMQLLEPYHSASKEVILKDAQKLSTGKKLGDSEGRK